MSYELENPVSEDVKGYEVGKVYTFTEIRNPRYTVSNTEIKVKDNGEKSLTKYENGDTFTMESEKFNFYTHFEVIYAEYHLVPVTK